MQIGWIFKLKTGWDSEKESRPVCVFGAKERIEQCDLMQKNSADVSAICGKSKGITQEQLSIMLNVSANHLAKVETGSRCCSIELLQDLSSCLNVRTDYLLNGDAPHNNHLRERLTFLAQELEKITADLPVWG